VEGTLGQLNLLTRGESMVAAYEQQHAMRFDVMIRMRFDFCAFTDFQLPPEAFTRGLHANTVRGWRCTACTGMQTVRCSKLRPASHLQPVAPFGALSF